MAEALLKPLHIGKHTMANRMVMAPLTRCRATEDHVPTPAMVQHYADRASFGLIISEATQIEKGYSAFVTEPGIYSKEQVEGWRAVTDAVHEKGGLIFCQIHHCGRSTVQCNVERKVVAASAVPIKGHSMPANFARDGIKQEFPTPVEIPTKDIPYYVQLYATAAKNAMAAGFDGVQIHGANSYLIDGFLKDGTNTRTDEYGGSIENRCRFLFEVVDAVVAAVGANRTALRISPLNTFNDMHDSDPEKLTRYICKKLSPYHLAFLDVMRGDFFSDVRGADVWARESYEGVLFTGMGFDIAEAEETVLEKKADAVVFGVKAIANPDLVARAIVSLHPPLNAPVMEHFYTHDGVTGYNDYPTLKSSRRASKTVVPPPSQPPAEENGEEGKEAAQ